MSTPVGHSRRQPLQETHSFIVSSMSSEANASGPSWPEMARRNALARPRVTSRSLPVMRKEGHITPATCLRHSPLLLHISTAPWKPRPGAGIGRPVERGRHLRHAIVRLESEQRAVVHFRGAHDLAGVQRAAGIEAILHLLEYLDRLAAVHLLVEFGPHQPVAVLARVRTLVGLHHRERFLRDGAHGARILLQLEVQHRPHVQAADATRARTRCPWCRASRTRRSAARCNRQGAPAAPRNPR